MTRADRLALLLAIVTLAAVFLVTNQVFEGLPHLEDEYAYIWQAQTISRGDLTVPSPVSPNTFMVPFVVDYEGLRFGKYPPGWPAALSLGVRLGVRDWVNPFFAALCVWFTYRLVKRLLNEKAGLLAAFLTLVSPFFLVNGGSLLSHTWSYFLTLAFILSWLDVADKNSRLPAWLPVTTGGLTLGLLALTRPLTAVGVALPFFIHGIILLVRGPGRIRRRVLGLGLITGLLAGMILLWQYAVTGNPLLNPYTLWWPYDRLGFGPGVGLQPGGNNLYWAFNNASNSMRVGASDLFGWPMLSWLFMPFGLWALRRNRSALLVSSVLVSLLVVYLLYWIGSWVFGPRYYFEGMISAILLTVAGVQWLAGGLKSASPPRKQRTFSTIRFGLVMVVFFLLIGGNLRFYLPQRLSSLTQLYGVSRQQLAPFARPEVQALAPALIVVVQQQQWREYGTLLELSNPYLDSPFIFNYYRGADSNQAVIDAFPERAVYYYYADEPYKLYINPR